MSDSFELSVLEFDQEAGSLVQRLRVQPKHDVIGSAYLDCSDGRLIYSTEVRGTSDSVSTLHVLDNKKDWSIKVRQGVNALYPFGKSKVLVRTKTAVRDTAVVDVGSSSAPLRALELATKMENQVSLKSLFLDTNDLTLIDSQIETPLSQPRLESGRLLSYLPTGGVLETSIDAVITRNALFSTVLQKPVEMGERYRYYMYGQYLYAVVKSLALSERGVAGAAIYRRAEADRQWQKVAELKGAVSTVNTFKSSIYLVGRDDIARFDTDTLLMHHVAVDFRGLEPTSIAHLPTGHLAVVTQPTGDRRSSVWIVTADLSQAFAEFEFGYGSNPDVSSVDTLNSHR